MSDDILLSADARVALLNPTQWRGFQSKLADLDIQQTRPGYGALLEALGCTQSPGMLRALGSQQSLDDRRWVCADLAFLQVTQSGASMAAIGQSLALSDTDQAQLQADLADSLADHQLQLYACDATSFCLSASADAPLLIAAEPDEIFGTLMTANLPEPAFWRRVLNDVQIALNQSPLSQRRLAQGQTPINSLWLWGDSSCVPRSALDQPPIGHQTGVRVDSTDPILRGLEIALSNQPPGRHLIDMRTNMAEIIEAPTNLRCYWASNGYVAVKNPRSAWQSMQQFLSKLWQR